VVVTEVNPIRALEAAMDGFAVMKMLDAAKVGDIFVHSNRRQACAGPSAHFALMKDGRVPEQTPVTSISRST